MLHLSALILYASIYLSLTTAASDWDYRSNGGHVDPAHWYEKYGHCNGQRQSPIDISYRDVVYDPELSALQFLGYDEPMTGASLTNNGHTVEFDVPETAEVRLKSRSFDSVYRLKQFHFHWSQRDDTGSEHVIDSKHYPLEVCRPFRDRGSNRLPCPILSASPGTQRRQTRDTGRP